MKIFYYIFLILLAFCAVLLDTSFFSFLIIYNATILISLILLISMPLSGVRKGTVIYASFLILFFAVFSSLPVWFLLLQFMLIPLIVFYLNQRFALDQSKILVILAFVLCCVFFQLSLAVVSQDFSKQAFVSVISFTIINSIAGVIIFFIFRKMIKTISPFLEKM